MHAGFRALITVGFLVLALASLANAETICGDAMCERGVENPCTCPRDCGACAPSPYEMCVQYACDSNNVCRQTTVLGCCGNGTCEGLENFGNCPSDCAPAGLDFGLLSPLSSETFARGQKGLISVKLSSENREVLGAQLVATGFFGTISLFDDGKHSDGNSSDGIYSNFFRVPVPTAEGNYNVSVSANFQEKLNGTLDIPVTVKAALSGALDVPSPVLLGSNLSASGTVLRGTEPVLIPLDFNLEDPYGRIMDRQTIQTGANGSFSYSFRTSLLDSNGEWRLDAHGTDANNNRFDFSRTIQVVDPSSQRSLSIELLLDKKTIQKGESLVVLATVKDFGNPVTDATVELLDPLGRRFPLALQDDGKYAVSYSVPFEIPAGDQKFRVFAKRSTGILVEGVFDFSIPIEGKPFDVELLLPQEKKWAIGDTVRFRAHAEYAAGEPVLDSNAFVILNGFRVPLLSEGGGFYAGDYLLAESDEGSVPFEIVVSDQYANESSAAGKMEVIGFGANYYFRKYGGLFIFLSAFFSILIFGARYWLGQRVSTEKLVRRHAELLALEKRVQEKYFNEASIEKKDYESTMESYENERKETEKKLALRQKKPAGPVAPNGRSPGESG